MKYDKLDKLNDLKVKGVISEEEFQEEKMKLLNDDVDHDTESSFWGMNEHTYSMALHLSQLTNCIVPLLGLVLPIVMWSVYKDKSDFINQNGKHAVNWLISSVIYAIISVILVFAIIGIPLLIVLCIVNLIFCIMAGVKASDGKAWRYPMSISFIK